MLFTAPKAGLSISKRMTLWYSSFFMLLSLFLFTAIYLLSDFYMGQSAREQLQAAVSDSIGDQQEGDFEAFDDGVYLSYYNQEGQLLEGQLPVTITADFIDQQMAEITVDNRKFLYYDHYHADSQIWFRGVLSLQQTDLISQNLSIILLILLPIVLILVLGGGHLIIKRALAPLQDFSRTAKQIEDHLDLSQRITTEKTPKELHQLGFSFNRMLEKVESSYERERQFTSDVSHELRTPLTIIHSETQYASSLKHLSPEVTDSLTIIQRQTRQMNRLVTNLLDMTRMDKTEHVTLETLSLSSWLGKQIPDFEALAHSQDKKLQVSIEENLKIKGQTDLLYRLLDNLMSNAVKFSQKHIHIKAYQQENQIHLAISNDGPQIPDRDIDYIWDRFYQEDQSRHGQSLGLGLSFVKKIAELHQAKVTVTSLPEKTTFEIFFPSSS
ncbi:HAMP domain-containing sensor histidine kinase [Streptococcus rifensis]